MHEIRKALTFNALNIKILFLDTCVYTGDQELLWYHIKMVANGGKQSSWFIDSLFRAIQGNQSGGGGVNSGHFITMMLHRTLDPLPYKIPWNFKKKLPLFSNQKSTISTYFYIPAPTGINPRWSLVVELQLCESTNHRCRTKIMPDNQP